MNKHFDTTKILDTEYAELDYGAATAVIGQWAQSESARTVVVAPVSSLMMSKGNAALREAFDQADMITSDGMPIVWMRKLLGQREATRLYGPDLMKAVCADCAKTGTPIALIGGRPDRLAALEQRLCEMYPQLRIGYSISPPFRDLCNDEIESIGRDARKQGCTVAFIGLGCPKQEIFMERLREHFPGVQLGVGAAFDFIPGFVRQSPRLLQRLGLEWAFRIACEPRRLWRRYASTIPPFMVQAGLQLIEHRFLHVTSVKGSSS